MEQAVVFDRHRFDPRTGRLWAGRREVGLTPRAAAVLAALVARAGELVTRQELFERVWGDTVVSDAALSACIKELRGALADDARRPRFIETRHRRGYRFAARVQTLTPPREPHDTPARPKPAPLVVGREAELVEMRACLRQALGGTRQIVFVTGEPGIGKTTLIELFLAEAARDRLRIAQGRCIEGPRRGRGLPAPPRGHDPPVPRDWWPGGHSPAPAVRADVGCPDAFGAQGGGASGRAPRDGRPHARADAA